MTLDGSNADTESPWHEDELAAEVLDHLGRRNGTAICDESGRAILGMRLTPARIRVVLRSTQTDQGESTPRVVVDRALEMGFSADDEGWLLEADLGGKGNPSLETLVARISGLAKLWDLSRAAAAEESKALKVAKPLQVSASGQEATAEAEVAHERAGTTSAVVGTAGSATPLPQTAVSARIPGKHAVQLADLVDHLQLRDRRITKQDVIAALVAGVTSMSEGDRAALVDEALAVRAERLGYPTT